MFVQIDTNNLNKRASGTDASIS